MPVETAFETLRHNARQAFLVGVKAADPAESLLNALKNYPLLPLDGGKYLIISIGKAACKMAQAALAALPEGADFNAIAVTNYENVTDIEGLRVLGAGHPLPDAQGLAAAKEVMSLLQTAGQHDVVLALVSGGSSALLPAPVPGISLADKSAVNQVLLSAGLDITNMNLVRQSLSRLKGGGLLRLARPARVRSYILSDVLGDDLRVVGSGPSIGAIGTIAQARDLLVETGNFDKMPPSVQTYLQTAKNRPVEQAVDATLIGSNGQSLAAMAEAAKATLMSEPLVGDVRAAAKRIIADVKARMENTPFTMAYGGETTVELTGGGAGGRNQELALWVAKYADEAGVSGGPWCFLSGGTDGRDGPTDAAGGLVDAQTLQRISWAGGDIDRLLKNNDSYAALKLSGDLLMTGATGTNVADLQLFVMG